MALVGQSLKLTELESLASENLSAVELDKLRSLLMVEGNLSQLDIILEAIEYIKTLQSKLSKE